MESFDEAIKDEEIKRLDDGDMDFLSNRIPCTKGESSSEEVLNHILNQLPRPRRKTRRFFWLQQAMISRVNVQSFKKRSLEVETLNEATRRVSLKHGMILKKEKMMKKKM